MTHATTLTLRVVHRYTASAERVYDAWLDPATAGRWLFATPGGTMQRVDIDARIGGGFRITELRADGVADHHGRYVTLERPHRLAFDFWADPADADDPARITVDIVSTPDGCELTLTQQLPARHAAYADRTRHGWTTLLGALDRTLASP